MSIPRPALPAFPLALLIALMPCARPCAAQRSKREPFFYTAFAREFIGRSAAILVGDVLSIERFGASSKIELELGRIEWIYGGKVHHEREQPRVQVIADLGEGIRPGQRRMFFLTRPPRTRQYWVHGTVATSEGAYRMKREIVEEYLRIAFLPAAQRFAAVLAYLERTLATPTSGHWARWHALRELAELALDYRERITASRLRRWKSWVRRSKAMVEVLRKVEEERRRAERNPGRDRSPATSPRR